MYGLRLGRGNQKQLLDNREIGKNWWVLRKKKRTTFKILQKILQYFIILIT